MAHQGECRVCGGLILYEKAEGAEEAAWRHDDPNVTDHSAVLKTGLFGGGGWSLGARLTPSSASSPRAANVWPGERGAGIADLLRVLGWIFLFAGVIGAIVVGVSLGTTEVGGLFGSATRVNAGAVVLAVILAVQGIAAWAGFLGLATALELLIELRRSLTDSGVDR